MKSFTIHEINEIIGGTLVGNTDQKITGLGELKESTNEQLTFIGSSKYVRLWPESNAAAAIVNDSLKIEPDDSRALIKVKNADLAMAKLLEVFSPDGPSFEVDIHSTAVVHESVKIGEGCKIGANCYVGKDVVLGNGVVLYPMAIAQVRMGGD